MLGDSAKLPTVTTFVLWAHPVILALCVSIPFVAIALLFTRDVARSIYCLGVLALLSILQCILLYQALWSPLGTIVEKMVGTQ